MKIRNYLLASSVALLAACGGDSNNMSSGELAEQWAQAELFYSFPYHGQENVSLNAPLVLRFSDPIAGELSPSNIQLKCQEGPCEDNTTDRKSTRLNSSHVAISYAVFCLKKKTKEQQN